MKVAVCLHGYFGTISTNDFSTSKGGFEHIQQEIVSKCDEVDFYVHCWQPNCEEQVNNLYFPKRSIFEQQKDFENRVDQAYKDYPLVKLDTNICKMSSNQAEDILRDAIKVASKPIKHKA